MLGLASRMVPPESPSNQHFVAAGGLVFVNKGLRLPGSEPRGLQRVRTELLRRAGCTAGARRGRVYLWHRSSDTRMLHNPAEVEAALRKWAARFGGRLTVEAYDPARLPLRESLRRLCECALVVHMHGGLLFHSIGLPDGSAVVEMLPRDGLCTTGSHFNVALRHRWWGLGVAGHRDQTWSVAAVPQLEAVLEEVGAYLASRPWF